MAAEAVVVVVGRRILVGVVYGEIEVAAGIEVAVFLVGTAGKSPCSVQYPKEYLESLALKSNRPQDMGIRERTLRA